MKRTLSRIASGFCLAISSSELALASIEVDANFNGAITTKISIEQHHRHSGDCNWIKKGNTTTTHPDQILPLVGGMQKLSGSGALNWQSDLSSPFARRIRTMTLTSAIQEANGESSLQMQLMDSYTYHAEMYYSNDCNHWDGITAPSSASTSGQINIHYQVPANVWLLKISRNDFNGLYTNQSLAGFDGTLNGDLKNKKNKDLYVWVKPNTRFTIKLNFDETVLGHQKLFNINFTVKPMGQAGLNLEELIKRISEFETRLSKLQYIDPLIESSMSLAANTDELSKRIATINIKDAVELSDKLFKISNAVIPDAQNGLTVKTAAAMAGFQIAHAVLKDLSSYCREVSVHLPFSQREVQTSGLRAAGYWLSRSLSIVKNYSFADFEALFDELSMMQSSGYSYAQVFANENLRQKVKKSFEFIDRNVDMSHSPMISAVKGINKTLQAVGHIGATDQETQALLTKLIELRNIEDAFFAEYDRLGDFFKPTNNEKINVVPALEMLTKLKAGQKEIENDMSRNIRLLTINASEDKDALFTQFANLLSHQINLVEQGNPSVPFYESVRKAFFESQNFVPIIETARACVLGENLK